MYIDSYLDMVGYDKDPDKASRLHAMAVIGIAHRSSTGEDFFICRHTWDGYKIALLPCISRQELSAAGAPSEIVSLNYTLIPSTMGGGPALSETPVVADAGAVVPCWAGPEVVPC